MEMVAEERERFSSREEGKLQREREVVEVWKHSGEEPRVSAEKMGRKNARGRTRTRVRGGALSAQ